jgi:hypothetical protein
LPTSVPELEKSTPFCLYKNVSAVPHNNLAFWSLSQVSAEQNIQAIEVETLRLDQRLGAQGEAGHKQKEALTLESKALEGQVCLLVDRLNILHVLMCYLFKDL